MKFLDSLFGKNKKDQPQKVSLTSTQSKIAPTQKTTDTQSSPKTVPLKKWAKAISVQSIYKKSISFHVERFEEWQGGRCINNGSVNFDIHLVAKGDRIDVDIPNNEKFRIHKFASFPFMGSQVMEDRVQYVEAPGTSSDPTKPIVLHIFVKSGKIDYIRFAMSFPDRIVELYGYQVESSISRPEDISFVDTNSVQSEGYKLTFLSSLVNVAACDGDIVNEEMKTIMAFIQRENLSESDFVRVVTAPNSIPKEIPQSPALRSQHLRDIVTLAMVDGHFHPKEYALCQKIAVGLGFRPEVIDVIRQELNSQIGPNI